MAFKETNVYMSTNILTKNFKFANGYDVLPS